MPNGTVTGSAGNDIIDASFVGDLENDLIDSGVSGNGPTGNEDIVEGGAGNDAISSGLADDTVFGGDGADYIRGDEGNDELHGGEGDDIIKGLDDNDKIYGDEGDDNLFGDNGDDVVIGGDGNDNMGGGDGDDTLCAGDGDDSLFGGEGSDVFHIEATGGDTNTVEGDASAELFGFAQGASPASDDDIDVLRIGGEVTITLDNGTVLNGTPGDDFDLGALGSETGTAVLADGTTVNFNEIETIQVVEPSDPDACICFTPGTMVATAMGERPVESLKVGDTVITRDNGLRKIAWIGHKSVDPMMLHAHPELRPVTIKAGSLGNNMPDRDIMVSPNHRMLMANEMTSLLFDESETLVAAKHLVGKAGVTRAMVPSTTYIHILFETHEVVLANGAWSESFQPGDYSMNGLETGQRTEILHLFPELAQTEGLDQYSAARRSLKRHEAELLIRH